MNQAYYETTAFFLHHNCILAPVEFLCCTNDKDGYLLNSLNIFSRPFYLLENVVIFSAKPTGFFDICKCNCNVDISENFHTR